MLQIEKTVLPSPEQWEIIIEGMRNPLNSWDKSDSLCAYDGEFILGENDHDLMMQLAKGGAVHAKYRRMIPVYFTVTSSFYFFKELDTYKIGTVCNSCSTMHKIHSKPIELSDFSVDDFYMNDFRIGFQDMFADVVADCETLRVNFLTYAEKAKKEDCFTEAERKHFSRQAKRFWKGLIQLLPSSYNQKRTYMVNYEVLHNIYHSRKNHKLDEWHTLCDWIRGLPYSELITGGE